MEKNFSRKVYTSTIKAASVTFKNGDFETNDLTPITLNEKLTEEKALKIVIKNYGKKQQYIIREVEITEEQYEMSLNLFLKYATKITKQSK